MNQEKRTAISIQNLSKSFKLPHEKHTSLKSAFVNIFRKKKYEEQKALKNISFDIKEGEFFGIVGRNGSGKSTLLKIIAGIYNTTDGEVKVHGSLTPFIELGVGFNPELTGRENVYLNGALLGFNRREMNKLYSTIVEFAELEKFMDQKLKNYSSGMQVRLAFSIAIRARSDILLLDEVLAVGDASFQRKCYNYFYDLKERGQTVVFVSHNMDNVKQFCDRAVMLDTGEFIASGTGDEIAEKYEEVFIKEELDEFKANKTGPTRTSALGEGNEISFSDIKVTQNDRKTSNLKAGNKFTVSMKVKTNFDLKGANIGVNIKNSNRDLLVMTDTETTMGPMDIQKGKAKLVKFTFGNHLTNGRYSISIGVADTIKHKALFRQENVEIFSVSGVKSHPQSLTHPDVTINVSDA